MWPVNMTAWKICSMIERNPINSLHHWTIHPRKNTKHWFSIIHNADLSMAKSMKSEHYISVRNSISVYPSFNEHFADHFEIYWHETWRHTSTISLEIPPPGCNKANNTIFNRLRKNDVAAHVEFASKVIERARVTCYWCII